MDRDQCKPGWERELENFSNPILRTERADRVRTLLWQISKLWPDRSSEDAEIVVVTHSRLVVVWEEKPSGKFVPGGPRSCVDERLAVFDGMLTLTLARDAYHMGQYKSYKVVNVATDDETKAEIDKIKLVETEESKNYVHTFPEEVEEE